MFWPWNLEMIQITGARCQTRWQSSSPPAPPPPRRGRQAPPLLVEPAGTTSYSPRVPTSRAASSPATATSARRQAAQRTPSSAPAPAASSCPPDISTRGSSLSSTVKTSAGQSRSSTRNRYLYMIWYTLKTLSYQNFKCSLSKHLRSIKHAADKKVVW